MIILDVREKEEYKSRHIPHSVNCPLSEFDTLAPGILKNLKDSEIVIMCRAGQRAKLALNEINKKWPTKDKTFKVYDGGILRWMNEGNETIGSKTQFPIMRQVQIVASTLIFISYFAGRFYNSQLHDLALLPAFGLALSGLTGFCPMAFLLQRAPWNKK